MIICHILMITIMLLVADVDQYSESLCVMFGHYSALKVGCPAEIASGSW